MKNVTIVVILTVSGFLTACHTKDSNTQTTTQVSAQAPVPVSPSPIDTVRNGYLESNKTTTVGKALEGTFPNGTWKTFTNNKGATIVEYDASEPFSKFVSDSAQPLYQRGCLHNDVCEDLVHKIRDDCIANPVNDTYIKQTTNCPNEAYKQHADDPIPVGVQFSVNQDGKTFQYSANNFGWGDEELLNEIYK
jgi:hypothetical protein